MSFFDAYKISIATLPSPNLLILYFASTNG